MKARNVRRCTVSVLSLALAMFGNWGCADKKADATPPPATPAADHKPIDGVDLSGLPDSDVRGFYSIIEKYPSACGKAQSLEASVRTDGKCKRSLFAARYVVHLLRAHLLPSEVEEAYDKRFGAEAKRLSFDTKGSPLRGDANAPVTLVEFSDFQCPHCKHLQPELDKILEEYKGKVKLYFKNYPITRAHPDAALAAAAALAAGKQGKFWGFHDKLFGSDQAHEDMSVLEKYAKDLKLDMNKWKADIEPMKAQVEKDHQEGEKADIDSTPTLYIDGLKHQGPKNEEEIKDWIDEELAK